MRYILSVLILCSAPAEAGVFRQAMRNFCEKYLVAEAPWYADEQYAEMLNLVRMESSDDADYVQRLTKLYRETGGKVYWLKNRRSLEDEDRMWLTVYKNKMAAIEFELERLGPTKDIPPLQVQAARQALLDYHFLLQP